MMASLAAKIRPLQVTEDLLWSALDALSIDGVGFVLDLIGSIVNVGRGGQTDDLYRVRIRVEILVLRSNGRIEEILTILRTAVNDPTISFWLVESYDAAFTVHMLGTYVAGLADVLWPILKRSKAAGVMVQFEHLDAPEDEAFLWSEDLTTTSDPDHGFGDAFDAGVGGRLSSVYAG